MTRRAGPYSRLDLPTFSGKTREGAFLRGVRAELVKHVGGHPSATQAALIEAAAQLRLRITLMDRKFSETQTQTDHDTRTYLAWVDSLGRLMTRLDGLQPAFIPKPRWQPPAASPPATPTAAAMARTERLAQCAAELAGDK
jgi:hypothetical protein